MQSIKISYLADYPAFIDVLAPWLYEHWRSCLTQDTLSERIEKLQRHLNRDKLPIAWVAHNDKDVFATAALRMHDLPGREDLTPWLGGVFVAAPFRNRGIGTRLCAAVENGARSLLGPRPLYLFTLDQQAWYERQGWARYEPAQWCGGTGDIMVKPLI